MKEHGENREKLAISFLSAEAKTEKEGIIYLMQSILVIHVSCAIKSP